MTALEASAEVPECFLHEECKIKYCTPETNQEEALWEV